MYLKDESNSEESLDAISATAGAMDIVYDLVISPMEGKLSEREAEAIGIAGQCLKIVAQKAYAYEQMRNGEFPQDLRN